MEICHSCFKRHWRKKINKQTGLQVKHANGNLVYICVACGETQEEKQLPLPDQKIKANILYIDIEWSKTLLYNYGLKVHSKYIHHSNIVKKPYIIGWCASYMRLNTYWHDVVTPKDAIAWNDEKIIKRIYELIRDADIVAGHNVDGFDLKKLFTRFITLGYPAIRNTKTLDTLKMARSKFNFESNSLDFISKELRLDNKDKVTNEDWIMAHNGDVKALDKIKKYMIQDVKTGKQVLEEMELWGNKKPLYGTLK